MTTVLIGARSLVASGHTERDLCIAISAMVQTAGAVLDKLGVNVFVELDSVQGLYKLELLAPREREGLSYGPSPHEQERLWCTIVGAVGDQLTELAEDHPDELRVMKSLVQR